MKTLRYTVLILVAATLLMLLPVLAAPVAAADGPQLTVQVPTLNLRQGPGTNYAVIGKLTQGAQAAIIGRNTAGDWYQVRPADGGTGWVTSSPAFVKVSGDLTTVPVVSAPAPAAKPTGKAGSKIVFQTASGGPIYVANADGSNLRYLTTGIDPALSPDGRTVAFTRWDSAGGVLDSVWVIGVDGKGEQQIAGEIQQPKSPTWSADGKTIVVNMQQGGTLYDSRQCKTFFGQRFCLKKSADPNWALRKIDVATRAYADLPSDSHSFSPTFDPKNVWHVVYHGDHGLTNLDVNQGTSWPLTTDAADRSPAFSPDGSKIAVNYWQGDHWEIHVLNADGSGRVRLTQTPEKVLVDQQLSGQPKHSWNNAAPAWSPDGKQIAFVTDRTGRWEIWVMNADGSSQHALLPSSTYDKLPIKYDAMDERVITWR
jgi:dipeptidyl aminopeptidase/acylaminoacyl peptidase